MIIFKKYKIIALVLCYGAIFSRHMMLESWYMVRDTQAKPFVKSKSISTFWLSVVDACYLFSYATGNIVSGAIEDRYSLKKIIGSALVISAFFYWAIALVGYLEVDSPLLYIALWVVQGVSQSPIYPGCVALLGHWFEKTSRGKVMGFFSSSSSAGNSFSALLISLIFSLKGTWQLSMLLFSIIEFTIGVLFLFVIEEKPPQHSEILLLSLNEVEEEPKSQNKKGIPFIEAIFIPNLLNFAIAMACMKCMNYGLSMWIPFFLDSKLKSHELIGILTSLLEFGSLTGTIVCGWLGDRLQTRPPIISLFIFISFPFLIALSLAGRTVWPYFFIIPLAGFCVGAPNFIIGSAVAVDISQYSRIQHFEATATVSGIIDGSGGYGAGIGMLVIGALANKGWGPVFSFMLAMGTVAFLALYKISLREIKNYLSRVSN